MYRALYLAKRRNSLTLEDFRERWRAHSRLAGTLLGLRGYFTSAMQCARPAGAGFPEDISGAFDGISLIGLRDIECGQATWERPESCDTMQPDELKVFSRHVIHSWLITEELTPRAAMLRLSVSFASREQSNGGVPRAHD